MLAVFYDDAGNVIEMHQRKGRVQRVVTLRRPARGYRRINIEFAALMYEGNVSVDGQCD